MIIKIPHTKKSYFALVMYLPLLSPYDIQQFELLYNTM